MAPFEGLISCVFPHLSIMENINLAQMRVLERSEEATKRSHELLERVGITVSHHAMWAFLYRERYLRWTVLGCVLAGKGVILA